MFFVHYILKRIKCLLYPGTIDRLSLTPYNVNSIYQNYSYTFPAVLRIKVRTIFL